ncbi:MAG TPA: hypothetical protein VIK58_01255 [Caldimonas sp.]
MTRRRARIRSERTETIAQARHELLQGQDADPRGGELDRQGQPVEQANDLADGFALGGVGHEVVAARLRAMHEKIDCIAVERQGLQRKDDLARQAQRLAARDEERRLGGAVQPGSDAGWSVANDLLEVVEDQQATAAAGDRMSELPRGIVATKWYGEHARNDKADAVETARFRAIAEVHAARPGTEPAGPVSAGQPGLADASGAEDREQTRRAVQRGVQAAQLGDAPHEGIALRRKVVLCLAHRHPQFAEAHDAVRLLAVGRRDECGAVGSAQLADLERFLDAFQAVVPVEAHLRAGRRLREALAGSSAEQDLATGGERHQARGHGLGESLDFQGLGAAGDVGGRVPAQQDVAAMHPDARLQSEPREQRLVRKGERRGLPDAVEDDEEAVAAVDLATLEPGKQVARAAVVRGPELGRGHIAELGDDARAVDQIGEEQGAEGGFGLRHGRVPPPVATALRSRSRRAVSVRRAPASHGPSAPSP